MNNNIFLILTWVLLLYSYPVASPGLSSAQEARQNDQLTRRQQIKRQKKELWDRARVQAKEVWSEAVRMSHELGANNYKIVKKIDRETRQAIEAMKKNRGDGLEGWKAMQIKIREVMNKASQEKSRLREIEGRKRHELWLATRRERSKIWMCVHQKLQDLTRDYLGLERVDRQALVYVVPGTDTRFGSFKENANWLEENIESIVTGSNSSYKVQGFGDNYKQPWFPGDCTNKKATCYQTNVDHLATDMLTKFEHCCENGKAFFRVVAHSYGVAITYDALIKLATDPSARSIGFRVDRLVTLAPPPILVHETIVGTLPVGSEVAMSTPATVDRKVIKPSNVAVWKNIHGGLGHLNGIGDENNVEINLPGKFDHTGIVEDKRARATIREALIPCSNL